MIARCRACRAEVWFGVTPAGKRMPLDPSPVVDGNVIVDRTRPAIEHPPLPRVRVLRKTDVVDVDVPRYRSHFATCPEADRFRRPAPASAAPGSPSAAGERVPSTEALDEPAVVAS